MRCCRWNIVICGMSCTIVNFFTDRQVILGNHRDAWVFGAVDPNSATAVLMEMARALGVLRQNSKPLCIPARL